MNDIFLYTAIIFYIVITILFFTTVTVTLADMGNMGAIFIIYYNLIDM